MEAKTLFHGSKGGIIGKIMPKNLNPYKDFGQGFYMGTILNQARSLVAEEDKPYIYTLKFHLDKIPENRILTIDDSMKWAFLILYGRGELNDVRDSKLYKELKKITNSNDVIIGPIADDSLNDVMDAFVDNYITDKVFLECIKVMKYGTQYVAKTPFACSCVKIIDEKKLKGQEKKDWLKN